MGLDEQSNQMILSHEIVHIRQWHSLDLIFISFFRIVFWFNPITHLAYKEMSFLHECIADKEVLKKYPESKYLNLLANQTINNMKYQWINTFASVSSLKRIRAIKNLKKSPILLNLLSFIPLLMVLFMAISCVHTVNEVDEKTSTQNNEIVLDADEKPSYVGGMEQLIAYLSNNIKYPVDAKENGIEGKVIVSFVVEIDGSISNTMVEKGVHPMLDQEALRVVKMMPKWNPGKKDGENVKVKNDFAHII